MKKNTIIYGELSSGIQKKAVSLLSELLLDYTLEYPACYPVNAPQCSDNTRKFYIGTKTTNTAFEMLQASPLSREEEYRITVLDDNVYIEGFDDAGVLYGCIRAELTAPFTADEEAEFKDWLEGQCSDGYGEGLEQRSIRVEDGDMYVSFWHGGDDWFMLNGDEFDQHLSEQKMGGFE